MLDAASAAAIRDALSRGATDQALAAARDAVTRQPDDAQAYRLLALAQRAAGEQTQAIASLDHAIALAPDEAELHFEHAGLLLGERQLDDAQAALARSIGLDPNLFGAYMLQAQLALGRGDLDEAERQRKLAALLVPTHPYLAAIDGMLALRRGDAVHAQRLLVDALQRAPDDSQLNYALGFAYMAQGHWAFAEQAFRNVLAQTPDVLNLHALIADLLRQQGRPADALHELAPLLTDPARATPGLRRVAGELELGAGHPERALPWLRDALGAQPHDLRTLQALVETWRQLRTPDDARATLDAALATSPQILDLWQARLAFEPMGQDGAHSVVARWLAAMPDAIPALEAQMALQDMAGNSVGAEASARRIVALEPGRASGESRLLEALLQRDPAAAVTHVEGLLSQALSDESRRLLRSWLGATQDRAGMTEAAVATWSGLHAQADAAGRVPLWTPSAPRANWPGLAASVPDAPPVGFLWGAPGSSVERIAAVLFGSLPRFRADRFGPTPPRDGLQQFGSIAGLDTSALDPAQFIAQWRDTLPDRDIHDGQIVDWLPYWDNVLLLALRPQLPDALLLIALRDPRDMLLDWLAFGTAQPPLGMQTPLLAARWLAQVLHQVATLHEQDLVPHRLLRLDTILDQPQALAHAVGVAMQTPLAAPSPAALGARRFPVDHWRAYEHALAEPFAVLTPVARRLGYP